MHKRYPDQIGVGGLVLSQYEKDLVNKVLDSNRLTYGPMTKEFEKEFSHSHSCKYGLFMNSGTSALQVALAALRSRGDWRDGDEVIVPSVTFVATANIVLHNCLKPVLVDVEPNTYNIDPSKIEEKITDKTRAIIPVHLLGLPASMDPILEVSKKHNLVVLEDSCETMFAKYKDQFVGSMGEIGCFSTYVAHFLVTGIGGFAITNDSDLAVDMRSLMNHGRDSIYISCSDDAGLEKEQLTEVIERRFSFVHVGHSFRATEMESAIGLGQLAKSKDIIEKRKAIAEYFNTELSEFSDELQLPHVPEDRTHSYMLYGILVKNDTKARLVNYLENANIETRDLLPLTNQPIYKKMYDNLDEQFPIARKINNSGFYIGCHSYMTDGEVQFVVDTFRRYFKG